MTARRISRSARRFCFRQLQVMPMSGVHFTRAATFAAVIGIISCPSVGGLAAELPALHFCWPSKTVQEQERVGERAGGRRGIAVGEGAAGASFAFQRIRQWKSCTSQAASPQTPRGGADWPPPSAAYASLFCKWR